MYRLAPLFLVAACQIDASSGPLVTQSRTVDAFESLDVSGAFDLRAQVGVETAVSVECGAHVIDRIVTEVRDNTLVVRTDDESMWPNLGPCTVTVAVPEVHTVHRDGSGRMVVRDATDTLTSVTSAGSGTLDVLGQDLAVQVVDHDGSGSLEVSGIDTPFVDLYLQGSGSLIVQGRADEADVSLDGSGLLDAQDLQLHDAVVRLDGSGTVRVTADERADVTIGGSGTVRMYGGAQVHSQVDGSGRVVE